MSTASPRASQPAHHRFEADLVLILTGLIAAAGWIFSKEALVGLPPLLFIGLRFAIAGLVLGAFSVPQLRTFDAHGLRSGLLVGALFAAGMVLWILGLSHARHLGEAAFISSLGIVAVPVLARVFFGDRPPASTWFALPPALAGFACLSLDGGFRVEPGQWFFLAAAMVFALLFNVNSHIVRKVPVRALSTVQMLVVGVLVLPPALMLEQWPLQWTLPMLGWLLASAVVATTLRFMLQLRGQSLTTPSHAALILMLEPVWTAIAAAWWYAETMSALQLLGCGLIFLALVASRWVWIRGLLGGR
ncbi:DMT family transporter [Thauera sp. WH-2]|uniref:DMT family transporter n=1 Tax=Thauera sp. WH-2 TaxID=3401574 RepID=UPI003AAC2ED0